MRWLLHARTNKQVENTKEKSTSQKDSNQYLPQTLYRPPIILRGFPLRLPFLPPSPAHSSTPPPSPVIMNPLRAPAESILAKSQPMMPPMGKVVSMAMPTERGMMLMAVKARPSTVTTYTCRLALSIDTPLTTPATLPLTRCGLPAHGDRGFTEWFRLFTYVLYFKVSLLVIIAED